MSNKVEDLVEFRLTLKSTINVPINVSNWLKSLPDGECSKIRHKWQVKKHNITKHGLEFPLTLEEWVIKMFEAGITSDDIGISKYHLSRIVHYNEDGSDTLYTKDNCNFQWYTENMEERQNRLSENSVLKRGTKNWYSLYQQWVFSTRPGYKVFFSIVKDINIPELTVDVCNSLIKEFRVFEEKKDELVEADEAYYESSLPIMSDTEYDSKLEYFNSTYYEIKHTPKSESNPSHLKKFKHSFTVTGLSEFKIGNILNMPKDNYCISNKEDGISVVLYYDSGKFIRGMTRHEGDFGLDITDNIKFCEFPRKVDPKISAVRGEVIVTLNDFKSIKEVYATPRNAASGICNSKYSSNELKKKLSVVCYDIPVHSFEKFTFVNKMKKLEDEGFSVVNWQLLDWEETIKYLTLNNPYKETEKSGHLLDGFVCCSNTGEASFKIKYPAIEKTIEVINVEWQESGFGRLIPVIKTKEIELDGAIVTRFSGFNAKSIKDNGIGPGAEIRVCRANMVIPHWVSTVKKAEKPDVPTNWNGSEVKWDGVHLRCKVNIEEKVIRTILDANTPDGIGGTTVSALIEACGINSLYVLSYYSDYLRHYNNLMTGDKEKLQEIIGSGDRYLGALETLKSVTSRPTTLDEVLIWSWTEGLGGVSSEIIANKLSVSELLENLVTNGKLPEEIESELPTYVPGEGIKDNKEVLINLLKCNFNWSKKEVDNNEIKYRIALTGSLSAPRKKLLENWKKYGVVEESIGKSDYLITDNPDSGSSKNKQAQKLGIKVITEGEFNEIIGIS